MEFLVLFFIFFVFVCQIFKNLDTKRTIIHTCTLTADQGEAPLPEADAARSLPGTLGPHHSREDCHNETL